MAVKIVGAGKELDPIAKNHPQVKLEQIEVFGRLRMTVKQIAEYYGMTFPATQHLMRRPDTTGAYNRGRAETVVAVRQKQLQLALGGNTTLLLHAGFHFGDQEKEVYQDHTEDLEPSRFSWSTEMKNRMAAAREQMEQESDEE